MDELLVPAPPGPGHLFGGRFELVRALSRGGGGEVFEVVDRRTARHRALKLLHPELRFDSDARARLRLEAVAAAELSSPHVVEVIDAGEDEATGCPYLVMPLLGGEDLGDRVARGPLPVGEALPLLRQVARGLDALHAAGVVHRDVKPENVRITPGEDGPRACLVDLGVAKVLRPGVSGTTRALGTPLYMAPEQVEGRADLDGRVDVYALGQLAFTLLAGRPYFDEEQRRGAFYRVLLDATRGLPEPASVRAARASATLPRGFDRWFARATARDRRRRPSSAGAAVEELASALASGGYRRRTWASGAVAALLLSVAAAGIMAPRGGHARAGGAPPLGPLSAEVPELGRDPRTLAASSAPIPVEPPGRSEALPTTGAPPDSSPRAVAAPPPSPARRTAPRAAARPAALVKASVVPPDPTDLR